MDLTRNLRLPQYSEEDIFDLQDINKAYNDIDNAYEEIINFKEEIPKVNANAEIIEARDGEETLGTKIRKFNEQLETKANKQYVNEEIAKAQLEGSGVDTSNFVMKSELEKTNILINGGRIDINFAFEQGSFSNGLEDSINAYRIRTKVLKTIPNTTTYIRILDGYKANVAFIDNGVFKGETKKSDAGTIIKINGNAYPECRIWVEKDPLSEISPTEVGISAYCIKSESINTINNSIIPTWECGGIESDGLKDDFYNRIAYYKTNTIKVDKTIVISNSDSANHRFKVAYYDTITNELLRITDWVYKTHTVMGGNNIRIMCMKNPYEYSSADEYKYISIVYSDDLKMLEIYNAFDKNKVKNGYVHDYDAGISLTNTSFVYSDYIPIHILTSNTIKTGKFQYILTFFDKNKKYVSGVWMNSGSQGEAYTITDQSIAYVRCSVPKANINDFHLEAYRIKGSFFENKKRILCIGDSLTFGGISMTEGTDKNYPYYLAKELNAEVNNQGRPGETAQTWWNKWRGFVEYSYNYDVVMIMLGTNGGLTDTIDTDCKGTDYTKYADTTTGCYCKIIEEVMKKTNYKSQIVLIIPPYHHYSDEKYQHLQQTRLVVPKIAERYNLPVINAYNECGMGKYNASIFQPLDGLHFCSKGYQKLATYFASKIKSLYSYFDLY